MRPRATPGEKIEFRVAAGSPAPSVAGAIASYTAEGAKIELVAIGAGAVNQMMKALCIARGMSAQQGYDLSFIPSFSDEQVMGETKSAIRIVVKVTR